jgi:predicted nucleic acid-binding protein
MIQVSLDTSFLISFADPGRPHHAAAIEYFRYCLNQNFPMWISVVAAGEFEVGEPVSDLPLRKFQIQTYTLAHAIKAAALFKIIRETAVESPEESRRIIINDLKILAQAEEDGISVILTEDASTLSRLATRLLQRQAISVRVLLLANGFTPGHLDRQS